MKRNALFALSIPFALSALYACRAEAPQELKPRVLISTDIGGTDPDDNQSMAHLMMYTDKIQLEGIVSTPFSGQGSADEIRRMIDLYELDFPKLVAHAPELATPGYLRSITKQGARGAAPWEGYAAPTEGSEWIVECARKESNQPLYVLAWGGLEDVAQALHDAPDIASRIRVYWIGGPNKKWGANPYAYIAANFPDLWFIENNASYYGFFSKTDMPDQINPSDYHERYIAGAGHLGADFKNYYQGQVKMGDTPSLLYVMDGDPADPTGESWGGSFERFAYSPRVVFDRATTLADTVAYCSVVEFRFEGPVQAKPAGTVCFWMDVPYGSRGEVQRWPGYYLGEQRYAIRYIPKVAETLTYTFVPVDGLELDFAQGEGALVAVNFFPGKRQATDYKLGANWYTDRSDTALYDGKIQGGRTTSKWRKAALEDWAERLEWLREQ